MAFTARIIPAAWIAICVSLAVMAVDDDPVWVPVAAPLAVLAWAVWYGGDGRGDILTVSRIAFGTGARTIIYLEERIGMLRAAQDISCRMQARVVYRSGYVHDIQRDATVYTRASALLLIPCTVSGVVGAMYNAYLLCIVALPVMIYMMPTVRLHIQTKQRQESISREMPFFLVYVHLLQTVGAGLYRALEMIPEKTFPAIHHDVAQIRRRVLTGSTIHDALSHYARHHPVCIMADFVRGYVAKQQALGDVPSYTAQKAQVSFAEYETAWKRYEKNAQELLGGIMMFAIVLPMMVMLSAMLGTSDTINSLLAVGTLMSPAISGMMIIAIHQMQPSGGDPLPVWPVSPGIGAGVGAILWMAGMELAIVVSAACGAAAFASAIHGWRYRALVRTTGRMIPEFLRDITEISRTGMSVSAAISRQASRASYDAPFSDVIRRISAMMRSGVTLAEALDRTPYATAHMGFVMFLISVIYRTGGGGPALLHTVSEFADRIYRTKESVSKSLMPLCGIVYAAPFVTLAMAHLMLAMMAGDADVGDGDIPFSPISAEAIPQYTAGLNLMAASMAIPMGMVAAKIVSQTIRDTIPVGVASVCSMAAIVGVPILWEAIPFG